MEGADSSRDSPASSARWSRKAAPSRARRADAGAPAGGARQGDRPERAHRPARGRDEAALRQGLDRPLTQVANRRGLMQAFEVERARSSARAATFDRPARHRQLRAPQRRARSQRRRRGPEVARRDRQEDAGPGDRVARYGGEEFVVLLPATPAAEGEQVLTRLQRSLNGRHLHLQGQAALRHLPGSDNHPMASPNRLKMSSIATTPGALLLQQSPSRPQRTTTYIRLITDMHGSPVAASAASTSPGSPRTPMSTSILVVALKHSICRHARG